MLKLTISAHRHLKKSTLSHILKQARLSVDEFLEIIGDGLFRFLQETENTK